MIFSDERMWINSACHCGVSKYYMSLPSQSHRALQTNIESFTKKVLLTPHKTVLHALHCLIIFTIL